jgi:hypothetical protein
MAQVFLALVRLLKTSFASLNSAARVSSPALRAAMISLLQ